jgi:hypothetical protein
MAVARSDRKQAQLRNELRTEREQLAEAVESLRGGVDYQTMLRARLVLVAAVAFAAAFVLSGGIGAAIRLVLRRGREGHLKARLGRFSLLDRG